ncbi:MAG: ATP-binding cassette domain-containing protein, partial [Synechococcaceae bacterium WB9_4xB_025]|nr:ATP-binding cassette domain-containing protein [Synechococcaceae bacterium WB9_4xB_025]
MLELIDVHVQPATAEKPILSGINLQASRGQPLLISGASGSGKTTLLEVISGLSRPQRGSICWQGEPLTARQRRWITGVLFQFPERHFLGLNVSQELKLGHRRLSSDEQNRVLDQVGLRGVDGRQAPERLSGGQQRRLALAVQLLRQPEVLLPVSYTHL